MVLRRCISLNNENIALLISNKIKKNIDEKNFETEFERKHYYYYRLLPEINFMKMKNVDYSKYF